MNTAALIRVYEQNPTDDFVMKRNSAMSSVSEKINETKTVMELLGYANSICAGLKKTKLDGPLADICVAALTSASPAFDAEGSDVEIYVCALGASIKLLEGFKANPHGCSAKEVFAAALHSGLSYQPSPAAPKIEAAVKEILSRSATAFEAIGQVSRARLTVKELEIDIDENDTVAEACEKVRQEADEAINILRDNAILDREELELLWFCLADHSEILNSKISSSKNATGVVVAALETSRLLRRLPMTSHVHMALRHISPGRPKSLRSFVDDTKAHRDQFLSYFKSRVPQEHPEVMPVLSAVLGYREPMENDTRELAEWGRRLVLELGVAKFNEQVNA